MDIYEESRNRSINSERILQSPTASSRCACGPFTYAIQQVLPFHLPSAGQQAREEARKQRLNQASVAILEEVFTSCN